MGQANHRPAIASLPVVSQESSDAPRLTGIKDFEIFGALNGILRRIDQNYVFVPKIPGSISLEDAHSGVDVQ
jgi:hypothetical protein